MIKEKLNLDPSTEIAKHMKMTKKVTNEEKRKQSKKKAKATTKQVTSNMQENGLDQFLASGKSFQKHDKERFQSSFV